MHRILHLLIAASAALILSAATSAADFRVKLTATDSLGAPEPYATVRVFTLADTVKPIVIGVTNEKGAFNNTLPKAGEYRLTLYSIGKTTVEKKFEVSPSAPVKNLGTLILYDSDNTLGELVVVATKPLVSLEVDRIGYDVQADEESKTSMLDEMLRKVPMVSVDPDGTIKVNGSTDFKIYKNGRPNNSYSRNAKDIFKALPASMIEKIEVITEPGAREDAEGVSAILNIVTMKNTVTKGAMGNISLSYRYPNNVPNPNIWLSAQYDKVALSFYGGLNSWGRRSSKDKSESETIYEQTGNVQTSESESTGKGNFGYFGGEGSWEPDTMNLVTFEIGGFFNNHKSNGFGTTRMFDAAGNELYRYSQRTNSDPNRWADINGSLNYQRNTSHKGETLILSYRISNSTRRFGAEVMYEDWTELPVPYTGRISDNKENGIEHTFQFDWTRPFAKIHTIDLGAKYIYRDNHSRDNLQYIDYRDDYSEFKHTTQVAALFADYRLNLGKFGARAGLRYEYSHLAAKYPDGSENPFSSDLNDWVPNVGLIYNPSRQHSLKLSFGSRIQRPGITYLNPTVNESPNLTSQGNPDLESVRKNSVTLNYNYMGKKLTVGITPTFSFSNNDIISTEYVEGDHRYTSYGNLGELRSFRMSAYINWRPTTKTSLMFNGSIQYSDIKNPSLGQKSHGWGNDFYGRISQRIPWDLNLSLYASSFVSPKSLYSKFRATGWSNIYYGISLQKGFLKEKRLNVNLSLYNPIHSKNPGYISTTEMEGYSSRTLSQRFYTTTFSASVSYRFGKMTTSVKKVNKGIQNDDVVGGGNSGNSGGNGSGGN